MIKLTSSISLQDSLVSLLGAGVGAGALYGGHKLLNLKSNPLWASLSGAAIGAGLGYMGSAGYSKARDSLQAAGLKKQQEIEAGIKEKQDAISAAQSTPRNP